MLLGGGAARAKLTQRGEPTEESEVEANRDQRPWIVNEIDPLTAPTTS